MGILLRVRILWPEKLLGEALAISSIAILSSRTNTLTWLLKIQGLELMSYFAVKYELDIRSH